MGIDSQEELSDLRTQFSSHKNSSKTTQYLVYTHLVHGPTCYQPETATQGMTGDGQVFMTSARQVLARQTSCFNSKVKQQWQHWETR
jgi:hypothetical protein